MTELRDHDRPLNSLESAFTAELGEKDEGATLPYCSNLSRKETLVAIPRVVQYHKNPPHTYISSLERSRLPSLNSVNV